MSSTEENLAREKHHHKFQDPPIGRPLRLPTMMDRTELVDGRLLYQGRCCA
jgi:hypothetical protein